MDSRRLHSKFNKAQAQEQIARRYASELAQRSLVQVVSKSKAQGWIEEIRVHDILRDWCVEEARYAGFVDVIDSNSGQASCPHFVYIVVSFLNVLLATC
jgi:hypothetical protein